MRNDTFRNVSKLIVGIYVFNFFNIKNMGYIVMYIVRTLCHTFRKERLIFHDRGFQRLKEFIYAGAVLTSGNLLFEEGALPMVDGLVVIYRVSMVNAHGFHLCIEHLQD